MKLLKKRVDKAGNGLVVLTPDNDEDLWHIYNLVQRGDSIKTGTFRKVKTESKTGSVTTKRMFMVIKLQITSINYYYGEDAADIGLLLKGKNIEESKFMQIGQMHTIKVELNYPITIYKNNWDKLHMRVIHDSTDVAATADIAALIMDEALANLCIVSNMTTLVKARIERNIPKKFSGIFHYDKAMQGFFESILQAIINSIDFEVIKAFVIASPGFVSHNFHKFLVEMSEKQEYSILKTNKEKFIIVKSSSGYKGALNEVLSDPSVMSKLKDTKAIKEIEALDRFYKILQQDQDRVAYGHKYVIEANQHNAIKELLICDSLFRTKNFSMRRVYVDLVDKVKENGGEVYIFSRSHVSGEKLNDLSGIAAILRFPLNMDYLEETEDVFEKQREEEEKKENNEDDSKLSDVASFVHEDDFDKEFFEGFDDKADAGGKEDEEAEEKHPSHHHIKEEAKHEPHTEKGKHETHPEKTKHEEKPEKGKGGGGKKNKKKDK
jgi:protein pelota